MAYSVHDVEDGLHGGYIDLARLMDDRDEQAGVCADVTGRYSDESPAALEEALKDLLHDPVMRDLHDYDGTFDTLVALKSFTSTMVGRFVTAAVEATQERYGGGELRRYGASLIVPERERIQCALLKGIAWRYVMRPRTARPSYVRQREILAELVEVLAKRAPRTWNRCSPPPGTEPRTTPPA
ncbi:hypothetical protein GCM10029992_01340 [Glycomyces albus]